MKLQLATNTSANRTDRQFVFQTMPDLKRLHLLTEADKQEVLSFLKVRPVNTVVMTSFIGDNGLENENNRGTELLFELNFPFLVQDCEWEVRNAKVEELEMIAEAHAEVAFIESGVDPMEKDREGFLRRCLRRIEKGRTFVVTENGKLIFKADIVAETDDVVYLEGIYVAPEMRGQGIGSKCLSKLSLQLLERAGHICLLSNVDFKGAHRSFEKAGYKNTDKCQTIFV